MNGSSSWNFDEWKKHSVEMHVWPAMRCCIVLRAHVSRFRPVAVDHSRGAEDDGDVFIFIMGPVLRETVPSVVFRFYIARNPRALNFYCTSERRTVVFVMFRSVHRHVEIFYCRNVEGYGENLLALKFLLQVRMKARRFWHCENRSRDEAR